MSLIKQAYVSKNVEFFKKGFLSRYNLSEYNDIHAPAIFLGARGSSFLIDNHKGYKIVLPTDPTDIPVIKNYDNTFFICSEHFPLPEGVVSKSLTPEIKDYSMFKPNLLGDKIYTYTGFKNGWNLYSDIIKEIQEKIDFEIITTNHQTINDYYDIKYLKENFYDKTFLNINFSNGNGLASTIELGLMGRKTIISKNVLNNKNSFQRINFPNFIPYDNVEDIINIINSESRKIRTIQPQINPHNIGDEWIDMNFWL